MQDLIERHRRLLFACSFPDACTACALGTEQNRTEQNRLELHVTLQHSTISFASTLMVLLISSANWESTIQCTTARPSVLPAIPIFHLSPPLPPPPPSASSARCSEWKVQARLLLGVNLRRVVKVHVVTNVRKGRVRSRGHGLLPTSSSISQYHKETTTLIAPFR